MKSIDKTEERPHTKAKPLRRQANQLKKTKATPPAKRALRNALKKSHQAITESKQADNALRERLKELTCLYKVGLELQQDLEADDLCRQIIKHLVTAMEFPDITAAVIELDNKRCVSEKYTERLLPGLQTDIKVGGDVRGHVRVYSTEQRPFLIPHEQNLVINVAQIIGLWLKQKQAEETLKESEEKFRSLVESTSDWIWVIDRNGIYTYASPKVKDLLGYEPEEVIGKTPFDFMPAEEANLIANKFKDIIETGKPIERLENINRHKNGHLVILETSGVPVFDSEGRLRGYRGVDRNITERKQAEEESNFRAELLDAATDSILVHDFDGNIIYANEVAYKSGGYTKEEFMKMNIRELAVPEYAAVIEPKLSDFSEAGKAVFEFAHFRKDKSIMPVEIQSQIIEYGGRKLVLGIARDITERKKMQDSLIITDRLAALGNMAGGFAHELNNPLTGVIGYTQLLLDREDLPEEIRKDLTGIYKEAQRASAVIKNFMGFALKQPQPKQLIDVNSLIKDVLKLRQHEQKKANIRVNTNFAPELPLVTGGPVRMRQVFLDIITNAEYFMFQAHNKGTLTITTEKAGEMVKASFTDDGPGIPPENLGQVFNPFFTTKEIGQGIGLGLSICHSIVTEHGGKIYVESKPGKGATFTVELPINNNE